MPPLPPVVTDAILNYLRHVRALGTLAALSQTCSHMYFLAVPHLYSTTIISASSLLDMIAKTPLPCPPPEELGKRYRSAIEQERLWSAANTGTRLLANLHRVRSLEIVLDYDMHARPCHEVQLWLDLATRFSTDTRGPVLFLPLPSLRRIAFRASAPSHGVKADGVFPSGRIGTAVLEAMISASRPRLIVLMEGMTKSGSKGNKMLKEVMMKALRADGQWEKTDVVVTKRGSNRKGGTTGSRIVSLLS